MATKIVNNGKQAKLLKFPLLPCHLSIDRRIFLYPEISTHFSCPFHFIFRLPPKKKKLICSDGHAKSRVEKGGFPPGKWGKASAFFGWAEGVWKSLGKGVTW